MRPRETFVRRTRATDESRPCADVVAVHSLPRPPSTLSGSSSSVCRSRKAERRICREALHLLGVQKCNSAQESEGHSHYAQYPERRIDRLRLQVGAKRLRRCLGVSSRALIALLRTRTARLGVFAHFAVACRCRSTTRRNDKDCSLQVTKRKVFLGTSTPITPASKSDDFTKLVHSGKSFFEEKLPAVMGLLYIRMITVCVTLIHL